jgi:hypothetical protein
MFDEILNLLSPATPHAGISKRGFAQENKSLIQYASRIMWAHALHVPTVIKHGLHFGWEGVVMGDFYFDLCLHELGLTNILLNRYQVDDAVGPYENEGGCNTYRTPQMRQRAVELLYQRFPEAVSPRLKASPQGELWDVTIKLSKVVRRPNV